MLVNKRFGGEMKRRLGGSRALCERAAEWEHAGVRRHQKERIWQKSQHVANGQLIFNRPSRGGRIRGLPWRQSKYELGGLTVVIFYTEIAHGPTCAG